MTIEQIRARPQAVRVHIDQDPSTRYRTYGIQVYSEAEHNACLATLHATRDAAPLEIDAEAASVIAGSQASITAPNNSDVTALLTPEEGACIGTGYRDPHAATSRAWWHVDNQLPHTHTPGQSTPVNRVLSYTHHVGNRVPFPLNTCMASDTMPPCRDHNDVHTVPGVCGYRRACERA